MDGIAGVITAGGQSRRFGSDKALFELEGRTLLSRVAASLSGCAPKLLIAPPHKYDLPGWQTVPDARPGEGPLAGLYAALSELERQHMGGWAAFAAVDLPHLSPALWETLARFRDGAEIVCGTTKSGQAQPLAALYHVSLCPRAEALLDVGERRVNALLSVANTRRVPWADLAHLGPEVFQNVNTPQDIRDI